MKSFCFLVIIFILYQKATAGDRGGGERPTVLCRKLNEEYSRCGTACPLTCDNYLNPSKVCSKECVKGCVCVKGYVRNRAGDCVLLRDCPRITKCPAKEEYHKCGTSCPLTCRNHLNPPKVCTLQCVPGCQCKKGLVRNNDKRCVLPRECRRL